MKAWLGLGSLRRRNNDDDGTSRGTAGFPSAPVIATSRTHQLGRDSMRHYSMLLGRGEQRLHLDGLAPLT
jgi:hypothetical protein